MRKGLSVLLFAALATAAPVPKLKPTMADIYGEPTADEKVCVAKMDRNGTLTLTLPTTAAAEHPANVMTRGPLIARSVDGDFTLTTRMTLDLPKTAETTHRGFPPGAAAGLCVDTGGVNNKRCAAVTIGKNDIRGRQRSFFEYHMMG